MNALRVIPIDRWCMWLWISAISSRFRHPEFRFVTQYLTSSLHFIFSNLVSCTSLLNCCSDEIPTSDTSALHSLSCKSWDVGICFLTLCLERLLLYCANASSSCFQKAAPKSRRSYIALFHLCRSSSYVACCPRCHRGYHVPSFRAHLWSQSASTESQEMPPWGENPPAGDYSPAHRRSATKFKSRFCWFFILPSGLLSCDLFEGWDRQRAATKSEPTQKIVRNAGMFVKWYVCWSTWAISCD